MSLYRCSPLCCSPVTSPMFLTPSTTSQLTHQQGTYRHCWLRFQPQRFYWTEGTRRHRLYGQSCRSLCRCRAPAARTGCRGRPVRWSDRARSPAGAAAGLCSVPRWSHIHWLHSPPGRPKVTETHGKTCGNNPHTHWPKTITVTNKTWPSEWERCQTCSSVFSQIWLHVKGRKESLFYMIFFCDD